MSHWAEIDENNLVIRVLVGNNDEPDEGKATMESLGGRWIQTSYNKTFRANFAGIGFKYDDEADAFVPPMPDCGHDELILNRENFQWQCLNIEHDEKSWIDELN